MGNETFGNVLFFDRSKITAVAKALSSETRVNILEGLRLGPRTISQIAADLGVAQPAVTKHVQILKKAGLIQTYQGTGERGTTKLCLRVYNEVHLRFSHLPEPVLAERNELTMPPGGYSRCEVHPTCGLASATSIIGYYDDPRSFYLPEHYQAEILWFDWGYVEYDFPNPLLPGQKLERIDLAMEVCSEAPGFDNDHPSEITFSINGQEIGTWISPGDMGDKRGQLNPAWWPSLNTQYGFLKTVVVNQEGASLDGVKVSHILPHDLISVGRPAITVRLEVKDKARYRGGMTLFGKSFGNYRQDITLILYTQPQENSPKRQTV